MRRTIYFRILYYHQNELLFRENFQYQLVFVRNTGDFSPLLRVSNFFASRKRGRTLTFILQASSRRHTSSKIGRLNTRNTSPCDVNSPRNRHLGGELRNGRNGTIEGRKGSRKPSGKVHPFQCISLYHRFISRDPCCAVVRMLLNLTTGT